ncbi:Apoptotic protease-activating factor 1, partial [Stegodyphus mimosarum]
MSIFTFDEHNAEVLCCAYSPDDTLIVSSDSKGCVIVWEAECGFIKFRKHHSAIGQSVNFCSFNKSGTVFGATGYDAIDLWDSEKGNLLQTFLHWDLRVERFCFTNDGYHIISVFDNSIYKWDLRTNLYSKIKLPSSKNFVILSCCLSADGNFLACGTSDSSVIILDMNSEAVIYNVKGHKESVINVMFSTDGKKLLSVSYDWYVIHDMTAVKNTSAVSFEGNLSVQLKDELLIATSSYWKCVEIRRGFQGELICQTEAEKKDICSLSSSISEVVYGMEDGSLKVLNISSKNVTILEKHEGRINYILHSKKGSTFFTCSEDKTLRVWKEGESLPIKVLRGHSQSVLMCVQFRTCDWLVSCSKDGTLRVWDVVEGDLKFSISEGHGNQDVLFCDISHDDSYIASASSDKTVKVWHTSNGQLYKSIECSEAVRCCRFYFSSYVLISGDDSGAVTQWHFGGKGEPKVIGFHDSQVRGIYFAVNGSQFITVSDDIKLWKRDGTFAQTLLLPTSFTGVTPPSIWPSDNFDIFVIVHNSVLYILKKI